MGNVVVNNPFIVGKYLSDQYFCDRRRIGKSGLIQHFFNRPDIKDQYYVFFIDIYATTSLAEFVYALGKEIYERLKPQSTIWKEKQAV